MEDIYDALDRIQIGMEKKGGTFSADRQKLVAYLANLLNESAIFSARK
jgi:ATP-dependent Zn protease